MPINYGSMSVPGASDLGLSLENQVVDDTDELKKKRQQAMLDARRSGLSVGASTLMNSTGTGTALSPMGAAAGFGR